MWVYLIYQSLDLVVSNSACKNHLLLIVLYSRVYVFYKLYLIVARSTSCVLECVCWIGRVLNYMALYLEHIGERVTLTQRCAILIV